MEKQNKTCEISARLTDAELKDLSDTQLLTGLGRSDVIRFAIGLLHAEMRGDKTAASVILHFAKKSQRKDR